jgi:hypothetical protein
VTREVVLISKTVTIPGTGTALSDPRSGFGGGDSASTRPRDGCTPRR